MLDVRAAGVNFPDLLIISGKYQFRPPLPFVPGGECAGTIAAIGAEVEGFELGQAVMATSLVGAFAEQMAVPAGALQPLPAALDFATAAGVSVTYGTSYYALKQQARLRAGETLLVLGAAGGVGMAAVQIGKQMGARVIAAASSAEKLDAAVAAGADLGINYAELDAKQLKESIKELTDGQGVDVVCDPVGGAFSEAALRATAWNGRFLVIGFASGEIPKVALNLALLKGAHIIGVFWGTWAQCEPAASRQNLAELQKMFTAGQLIPRVTTYPLADFRSALTLLAERRALGKVVLEMGE